jgi:hypothetical protein
MHHVTIGLCNRAIDPAEPKLEEPSEQVQAEETNPATDQAKPSASKSISLIFV